MRRSIRAVTVLGALALLVSCTSRPPASQPSTTVPAAFTCPHTGPDTVVIAGDSLVGVWPKYLDLPAGTVVYNVAKGGAGFASPPAANVVDSRSIAQRVLHQLDLCGDDVGLVVVTGGVNDLAVGQDPLPLIDGAAALDTELQLRGVEVVWLPITPWALLPPQINYDFRYDHRDTYHAWLRSPGAVSGTVLECNDVLQAGAAPEQLASAYYSWISLGVPDRFHPSAVGYDAFASCLSPLLSARLG